MSTLYNRAEELKHPRARIAALEALENKIGAILAKEMDAKGALIAKQDAPIPNGVRLGERIMRVEHLLTDACALAEYELDQVIAEVSKETLQGDFKLVGEPTASSNSGR